MVDARRGFNPAWIWDGVDSSWTLPSRGSGVTTRGSDVVERLAGRFDRRKLKRS
jgi:hypothetical protein